jgi:hypothetical protein
MDISHLVPRVSVEDLLLPFSRFARYRVLEYNARRLTGYGSVGGWAIGLPGEALSAEASLGQREQ